MATFGQGDTILRRGAANQDLHFVLSGCVHVHFDMDNLSQPIALGVGEVFGEISVIEERPISAFVIAAEPCRILLLPAAVFWSEVASAPGVTRGLMRALCSRLRNNATIMLQAMQERLRHEALEAELRLAREIQMGMLRHASPWFPDRRDFSIFAHIEPAKLVGGDLFDAFLVDADHLVLLIGDVSGKGISAALFMVRALTLLRSAAVPWLSLLQTVQDVNRMLADENEAMMFLTLFMAVLDLRTGELEYVNYGHEPPLVRAPDGSVAFSPTPAGTMFGLSRHARAGSGSLVLAPGSTLLLYTDGVTEAMDPEYRQFGPNGLLEAAAAAAGQDPDELINQIVAAVNNHVGAAEQSDDVTMLAVTFNGRHGAN